MLTGHYCEDSLDSAVVEFRLINCQISGREAAEYHFKVFAGLAKKVCDRCNGDFSRRTYRVAVNAGADRRKGNTAKFIGNRQIERSAVAAGKQGRLILTAAAPDRADRVNNVFCRQVEAGGDFCIAGVSAAESPADLQQIRAGSAVNRPVNSATAEQAAVRSIYDSIDL